MKGIRSGIPGINRTTLWNAWKQIRQEARHSTIRDVVDWLDFDLDPEVWISRLVRQLNDGTYEPKTPQRFTLAKANGFSRRMTLPDVRDLVLYRAITHHCYKRASRREREHVYFERSRLAEVQARAVDEAIQVRESPYTGFRRRRFLTWLRYEQYRKHLILEKVFPCIVVSDVTNFFDSILYQRVADSLAGITSARMLGLLFFLLEKLSIRDPYSATPLVGLPVDEFDCSRALAHMVLFLHDDRVVGKLGERAYVRWMDDQNVGVGDRAEGLRMLALIGHSLSRLHLTANSGKSKVLSLSQARRHYHLDLNGLLDRLELLPRRTIAHRKRLRRDLKAFWVRAKEHEGVGEWSKVLKRTYRLAGLANTRWLRSRCAKDIRTYPDMVERIADYVRTTGTAREYLDFAEAAWRNPEQIYPDVNLALFERLLLVEATDGEARRVRRTAARTLAGNSSWPGAELCATVAPLLLLRFGDRRSLRALGTRLQSPGSSASPSVARAVAIVFASFGRRQFYQMRREAARALRGELGDAVRMCERILEYETVPDRFRNRFKPIWDAVRGQDYFDMRRILSVRLLLLNKRPAIRSWLGGQLATALARDTISDFDRRLLRRLLVPRS